jgi:triosephosphate isomerase
MMLKEAGATWVILGHSERRAARGETSEIVRTKIEAAEAAGLTTITCVGETLAERDSGKTKEVVTRQLEASLPDKRPARWVVAYEPVWAIGSGRTPKPDDIAAVHRHIQVQLQRRFDRPAGLSLLYGGSVNGSNAREILSIPGVDGALVGGASLKAEEFWAICSAR